MAEFTNEFIVNNLDFWAVSLIFFSIYICTFVLTFTVLEFKHPRNKLNIYIPIFIILIYFIELFYLYIITSYKIPALISTCCFLHVLPGVFIAIFLSKVNRWKSAFIFLSAWTVNCACMVFCSLLGNLVANGIANHIFRGALNTAMMLSFAFFAYRRLRRPTNAFLQAVDKKWHIFTFVPVFVIFVHAYYFAIIDNDVYIAYLIMLAIFTIFAVFYYLLVFSVRADAQAINITRENEMYSMQVDSLKTQLETIVETNHKMRIMRHDLKHYIATIETLVREKQFDKTIEYTNWMSENIKESTPIMFCQNVVINACFSHYYTVAQEFDIEIGYILNVPIELNFSEFELSSVIANCLENAIHACDNITEKADRKITCTCRYIENSILIKIANKTDQPVMFDQDGYPVRCDGSKGVGTRSIVTFAKKHGAILKYEYTDNIFTTYILVNF